MKIKIIEEPPFEGPNYAKEALTELVFFVDENAPTHIGSYPVKKELLMVALEEKDPIAFGWWREHFWPPTEEWIYFPKECCKESKMIEAAEFRKMGARFTVSVAEVELYKLLSDKNQDLTAVNLMAKSIIPELIKTVMANPVRTVALAEILIASINFMGETRKDVKKALKELNGIFTLIRNGELAESNIEKAMKFCGSFWEIYPKEEDFFDF